MLEIYSKGNKTKISFGGDVILARVEVGSCFKNITLNKHLKIEGN